MGEIGLDYFVTELCTPEMRERQWQFYLAQLRLAQKYGLPVILHVRRSADMLLKGLRQVKVAGGIAHAFNGSAQQAQAFMAMGFALGFGGAMTYERATALRELARTVPEHVLVLETDAPDIPPHWLYQTAQARAAGLPQGRNTPAELPRIARLARLARALDVRGDAREHLGRPYRLGDVVHAAGGESRHDVFGLGEPGHEDHRDGLGRGIGLETPGSLEAVELRDGQLWLQGQHAKLPVQFAVLDLNLPGISGVALAHRLREMAPALRMVIMTAAMAEERAYHGPHPEGVGCLIKPFRLAELEKVMFQST